MNVSARTAKNVTEKRKRQRQEARDARIAELEVRATTVAVRPSYRQGRKLPEVTLNVVLAEEPNPPEGATPIQWLLVTTLPIDDAEQVQQIVSNYSIRWQIEIYFKTLKSACRIEDRQFETSDRILNCLAVYSIIVWKVMYLTRLGRECPDLSCELIFDESEWKSVYMTVRQEDPPSTPPSLNEMIRRNCFAGRLCHQAIDSPWSANTLVRSAKSSRPVHPIGDIRSRPIIFFRPTLVWYDERAQPPLENARPGFNVNNLAIVDMNVSLGRIFSTASRPSAFFLRIGKHVPIGSPNRFIED